MATAEQRDKSRAEVQALLTELSAIDVTSLGRRAELSQDINFERAVPDFQVMLDLLRQLSDRDLSRVVYQELELVKAGLTRLQALVKKVRDFKLNQGNPGDVCTGICNEVEAAYDDVMKPLMLSLAFTATQATDYAKIEREARGFHAKLKEEAAAFSKTLEKQAEEAQRALAAIKEQAAEAGISAHAQIYAEQAGTHAKLASNWFWAAVIATIITLAATIAGFVAVFHYTPESVPEAIQYVVAKLLVLSVLSFAIIWTARNYRSHKHNEVLNRHRANSLATFQTFIEGTHDSGTRDAILMFCAHAAFGHHQTGFEKHETSDGPPQIVNPVVDLLREHAGSAAGQ